MTITSGKGNLEELFEEMIDQLDKNDGKAIVLHVQDNNTIEVDLTDTDAAAYLAKNTPKK